MASADRARRHRSSLALPGHRVPRTRGDRAPAPCAADGGVGWIVRVWQHWWECCCGHAVRAAGPVLRDTPALRYADARARGGSRAELPGPSIMRAFFGY